MPLPKPREYETRREFIARCMSDDMTQREKPDMQERAGMCHSLWERERNTSDDPE